MLKGRRSRGHNEREQRRETSIPHGAGLRLGALILTRRLQRRSEQQETCTEPEYLGDLRNRARSPLVQIEIDAAGGTPKTIVERAASRKKESQRLARKREDSSLRFDEVWCVFDVDQHPNFAEAKDQARDNGIRLAVSNPCFELWLLLHFTDHRAYIERLNSVTVVRSSCRVITRARRQTCYGNAITKRFVALTN